MHKLKVIQSLATAGELSATADAELFASRRILCAERIQSPASRAGLEKSMAHVHCDAGNIQAKYFGDEARAVEERIAATECFFSAGIAYRKSGNLPGRYADAGYRRAKELWDAGLCFRLAASLCMEIAAYFEKSPDLDVRKLGLGRLELARHALAQGVACFEEARRSYGYLKAAAYAKKAGDAAKSSIEFSEEVEAQIAKTTAD